MAQTTFIRPAAVRAMAKRLGKRVGKGFLHQLDVLVAEKVEKACGVHNGGKKTLDETVALLIFGKYGK